MRDVASEPDPSGEFVLGANVVIAPGTRIAAGCVIERARKPRVEGEVTYTKHVAAIVQRREAESKDLIAQVQRRLDAGEAPELVKTWSDQLRKDIQAEALRELEWK